MTSSQQPSVVAWEIEKIVPYENNAKKHPQEQIEKLAKGIKEFGWDQPIVVDGAGVIIKGHGRRLAALHLGLKKVPVIVRADLSAEQVKAARLADNRVSSQDYDNDLIQRELSELNLADFDLSVTGFDERELEFLTSDFNDLDESAFTDDIEASVEQQAEGQKEDAEDADNQETPVAKVLGFKKFSNVEARRVRDFMAQVENETGKQGKDALIAWIDMLEN